MLREGITPNHILIRSKVSSQRLFDLSAPKFTTSNRIKKQT